MEKGLPYSLEAECGVLGAIIIDPDAVALVADSLKPADFYRNAHQVIYAALVHLYLRNRPADFLTLTDHLEQTGQLEQCGGASYITSLVNHVPSSSHIERYAALVRRDATRRGLMKAASEIAVIAQEAEDAETALERAEQLIFDLGAGTSVSDLVSSTDIMAAFVARLDMRQKRGEVVGIPTGFYELDILLGGMQPGELYILGGRPGTGKSSLMLNVLYDRLFSTEDTRIALFSLEMSDDDVARRLISMDSGIDSQYLRTRLLEDYELKRVIAATDRLSGERLFVDQSGQLSIAGIRSKCRRHKMKHGLDLIVVDYLQLMSDSADEKHKDNRVAEIGRISRGLKQLAKEMDAPVLALASLSRAVESRADKRPTLSDLRESGSIESDADVVLFISRHPTLKDTAILDIAKHRHGPTTDKDGILLAFDGSLTKFTSVAAREVEGVA